MMEKQPSLNISTEESVPQKRCSMCAQYLPITDFTTHKNGKYGRASQCRACIRKHHQLPHIKVRRKNYSKSYKYDSTEASKRYKEKHREEIRSQSAAYRERHREEIRERSQSAKAKAVIRVAKLRYRALRANANGNFTNEQFLLKCEYYGWCCYLCHKPLTEKTVIVEHRIPLSRGGTNWIANLAPSCKSCNSRKRNLTDREYKIRRQNQNVESVA